MLEKKSHFLEEEKMNLFINMYILLYIINIIFIYYVYHLFIKEKLKYFVELFLKTSLRHKRLLHNAVYFKI